MRLTKNSDLQVDDFGVFIELDKTEQKGDRRRRRKSLLRVLKTSDAVLRERKDSDLQLDDSRALTEIEMRKRRERKRERKSLKRQKKDTRD